MKAVFFDFWNYISVINVVLGILSAVVGIKSFFNADGGNSPNSGDGSTGNVKKVVFIFLSVAFLAIAICAWRYHEGNRCVPSVVHTSVDNAQQTLKEYDLILDLAPGLKYDLAKEITSQYPAAGEIVKKGSKVVCKYDDDSTQEEPNPNGNDNTDVVKVPDVFGMEQAEAIKAIHQSNLEFKVWWTNDGTFSDNNDYYVIEQEPVAGSEVEAGSVVKIKLTGKKPDDVEPEEEYFIVFDDAVTDPAKVNTKTEEVTHPSPDEVKNEKLVHAVVSSSNIDVSKAFISISVEGVSTGVLLCTDEGLPSFYITPGTYQILADFGNEMKTTKLEIFEDGEYALVFE